MSLDAGNHTLGCEGLKPEGKFMRLLPPLFALGLLSAGLSAQADEYQDQQLCGNASELPAEQAFQAFEACSRLLATAPMDFTWRAHVYNSRGVALAIMGDLEGAIEDFSQAIRNYPNLSLAHGNRGLTYLQMGDRARARRDFEMALSIDPHNEMAEYHLNRLTPTNAPAQDLVGGWVYDNRSMGISETYDFELDNTFVHQIWRILAGRREVIQEEIGIYDVQGDSLNLRSQDQGSRTYTWRISPDATGAISLFLQDAQGLEQQFYPSS
jgi:tetratricopeptide (TPR) repeat protein